MPSAAPEPNEPTNSTATIPRARRWLLFLLFFLISCGLGYPTLNRVDWREAPGGLEDVITYAAMVASQPTPNPEDHMRFRILVPYLARPIYRAAQGHVGTWDPIMFALLAVNSFFTALTAILLAAVVHRQFANYATAHGAALLFLLNFAVPNLRLAGLIDAGEACFFMLLVWSLCRQLYWTLPIWGILGATAKETFVPFLIVFTLTWWLAARKSLRNPAQSARWIAAAWIAALATLTTVQWSITHAFRSPLAFGLDLHHNTAYLAHFLASFRDRNLWYIFFWLLPLSLVRLNRLPRPWRIATATTCLTAFALDAYYGGEPGTIGRALFSIAGPLLTASVALLLFTPLSPVSDPIL